MSTLANSTWMIYGAYGYTGRLIVEESVRRGYKPILAGRNATNWQSWRSVMSSSGRPCRSPMPAGRSKRFAARICF